STAGLWVGWIAHLGVQGLLWSASLVDLAPWAVQRVPPPSISLIAAYYGALVAALAFRQRWATAACAGVAAACACAMVIPFGVTRSPSTLLRVTFLDVGQGDAAVVQFPDGRVLTIDAGGIAGTSFDIGGRVVAPALWALGIRRVTYMSITHSDPDHIGGAASLFRDF